MRWRRFQIYKKSALTTKNKTSSALRKPECLKVEEKAAEAYEKQDFIRLVRARMPEGRRKKHLNHIFIRPAQARMPEGRRKKQLNPMKNKTSSALSEPECLRVGEKSLYDFISFLNRRKSPSAFQPILTILGIFRDPLPPLRGSKVIFLNAIFS